MSAVELHHGCLWHRLTDVERGREVGDRFGGEENWKRQIKPGDAVHDRTVCRGDDCGDALAETLGDGCGDVLDESLGDCLESDFGNGRGPVGEGATDVEATDCAILSSSV